MPNQKQKSRRLSGNRTIYNVPLKFSGNKKHDMRRYMNLLEENDQLETTTSKMHPWKKLIGKLIN